MLSLKEKIPQPTERIEFPTGTGARSARSRLALLRASCLHSERTISPSSAPSHFIMTHNRSVFRLLRHLTDSFGWSARLALLMTGMSCMAASIGGSSPTHSTADAGRIDVRQLPVAFEAIGEDGASQRYHARFPNYDVSLHPGAVSIRLSDRATRALRGFNRATSSNTATLKLSFHGTDGTSIPVGKGKLSGKANYFIGEDPKKWITGVPLRVVQYKMSLKERSVSNTR